MKLYRRHLHSSAELKKEKEKLKARIKETELLDGKTGGNMLDGVKAGSFLAGLLSIFQSPVGKTVSTLVGRPLISRAGKMIPKKALLRFGAELIGGYAKWKALEFGFKKARTFIKKRKEKSKESETD